ncbi:DUF952 domain-containing protein [Ponticoccus sp. SC2-23]|uniref:DUF952 domain-containing protein n=1 Tax=Alexandriicola marinus TaxID=2081710 RepID=UPI000FDBF6D0|nr:DUF952 domain-containing protein [Alexandriicola marinus]MBM1219967.1 DUF952 domain-containing protein [Ponticoccus sp. SC6-9]MBM1224653.1 DUF952 domain-containing protein [Ponticoccus sp. SC6-15]MBM1228166.1 DUF952 domain-containing protein [Ponticoccus sp. SC6-38]MBM1234196.1 DUF952 domain-containing protein [Ponticoccus sp. SC6-45]MBM1238668.1 DUF952 domain-containing protein [Ponticoccus sp. SC6-49]MBM1242449.1 DUF952 domain-containing protein [Ponticoccus sp. SC2-64]MBM1247720.1 DUF9
MLIYKLFRPAEWDILVRDGATPGAPIDIADGYVHFSTASQVAETARRYFADVEGVVLVAVEADALGPDLVWEPSRGGDLFPHLYREMRMTDVAWHEVLASGPDGHRFPDLA